MSGFQPERALAPLYQDPGKIDLPRYPVPADGETRIAWAVPEPAPASQRQLIARWLVRRASAPLAKVVVVGSAAGWVAAATVFTWTLASGRAVPVSAGAQPVADMALGAIDLGTAVLGLIRWKPQSDRPASAAPRKMRRQMANARRPGTRGFLARLKQFFLAPRATASIPRPVRGPLVAGLWASVLAVAWETFAGDPGAFSYASAQGERLAAAVWMVHLIIWSLAACRLLSLRRSDQK